MIEERGEFRIVFNEENGKQAPPMLMGEAKPLEDGKKKLVFS